MSTTYQELRLGKSIVDGEPVTLGHLLQIGDQFKDAEIYVYAADGSGFRPLQRVRYAVLLQPLNGSVELRLDYVGTEVQKNGK